jgi:AsmA protein
VNNTIGHFLPILKRTLKYLGIALAVIFLVFGIASWIVFEKKDDWLLHEIQNYVRESQSGQLEIGSIDLRLFKSFPNITIELDSINYYELRDSLRASGEKPILHADQLFVSLEFLPLINEKLKISEVSLSTGQLNIIEYPNGQLNISRALAHPIKIKPKVAQKKVTPKQPRSAPQKKEKKVKPPVTVQPVPQKAMQVDLRFISVSDMAITWSPSGKQKPSLVYLPDLEVDVSTNEKIKEAIFTSSCNVQTLYINRNSIPSGDLTIHAEIQYEPATQQVSFNGKIGYDELTATLHGTYKHKKNQMLDLEIDASSNDLKLLSLAIKPEVLKQNPDLLKHGDIYANAKIVGSLKNQALQVGVSFGMRDLSLKLLRHSGTFDKVGFDGSFSSGASPDYSQGRLEIKNLRGKLPGGFLKGAFSIHNFVEPYLKYALEAHLKLDGYDEIFNLKSLKQLTGSVSLHADFDGSLKYFRQHTMDSSRSSSITLNDLSFVLSKTNQKVSGLSGKIENRNNLSTIQQLTFTYGKNDLLINGAVENLMHFILLRDTALTAYGKLQSRQLYTKDFIFDTLSSAQVQDRITNLSFDFQSTILTNDSLGMPDITFSIQNLSASLDKLPDLRQVNAKGRFSKPDSIFKFDLYEFHATLPQGKVDITGDLIIPQKRLWSFNAHINTNRFPWTYVKELVAEIRTDQEPAAKNLPAKEMDLLTINLDISASVITYPFDFEKLNIRDSKVSINTADSKTVSVNNLNIDLENLRFKHPQNSGSLTGLKSTTGTLSMKQLKIPELNAIDINLNVVGKNDSLDISFSSASQVAKSEKGKLLVDISKKERAYELHYSVIGANLEYFVEKFYKKKFMKGTIDYALDIHSTGPTWTILKQNMAGDIIITGDSLHLSGVDIDKVLRKFERSQNFNLTDVGAVLIAGPVGLAVTKGSDFVSLASVNLNPNHQTFIKEFHTEWRLENGQLITKDVAFATLQNRLAFNGRIDFARDSIPGLTIAVIDKNGCGLMDQKLYGKTNSLKTGKLNITKTLFGSVINFVNVVVGKDCKPVYTGTVKHPK